MSTPVSPRQTAHAIGEGSRPGTGAGTSGAESSADEITPIIFHERGRNGKYKREYDSTAVSPTGTVGSNHSGGAGRDKKGHKSVVRIQEGGEEQDGAAHDDSDSTARRRRRQPQQEEQSDQLQSGRRKGKSSPTVRNTTDDHQDGGDDGNDNGESGWTVPTRLKSFLDKYGSIELDNKGSVARDHLALERTFLAWLRTSLAFASIGIAVTQLFRLNATLEERDGRHLIQGPQGTLHLRMRQLGKPLGATFLGVAILILIMGGRRYFESQYWIIRGKFPASRGSVCVLTFIAVALIVTSLVLVCVVDPGVFEK